MNEIEAYIREYATSIGMDPEVAVRVAKAEALNVFDPTKPDLGGDDRSSFGPLQFHYGGVSQKMPNPGLGDEFTKVTGLDARDPSTWRAQIKFGLDWAKKNGWSPWMGAKAAGVGEWDGINGKGATATASAEPAAADTAASFNPYTYDALNRQTDPFASLASTLSSSVGGGDGTGGRRPSVSRTLQSDQSASTPAPLPDFAKATPAAAQPFTQSAAPDITPLAELFTVTPEIGQAAALNTDMYGRPIRRRGYG